MSFPTSFKHLTTSLWKILLLLCFYCEAVPTWPASTDELEDMMFLNTGYKARGFAAGVTPCSFSAQGSGRIAAAEWLRTAFHDMATGSVYTRVGGLDASIAFEAGGENIGAGFATTLKTFAPFMNSRTSMADLIALGVYTSVRSCGGPAVSIRGGRKDAKAKGPTGVPLPQNAVGTFINQFLRIGFNTSEMIAVTACGHALGGVHAENFPEIVIPGTVPNNYALFRSTAAFDETAAVAYKDGVKADPLVAGPCAASSRCSDARINAADGNVTIHAMADRTTFRQRCSTLLQRLTEVVPKGVVLTDPIVPYEVKPVGIQLSLVDGGTELDFTGALRVRTSSREAGQISSVDIIFSDRDGDSSCGNCTIATTMKGSAAGFDDSFAFYEFSTQLPATSSISSFVVVINLTDGSKELYDNNGARFIVQDEIMFQPSQSCTSLNDDSTRNLTIFAAVRGDLASTSTVNLTFTVQSPWPSPVPVPALVSKSKSMDLQYHIGAFGIYSKSFTIKERQVATAKFDLTTSTFSDSFKAVAGLATTCARLALPNANTTGSLASESRIAGRHGNDRDHRT